MPLRHIVLFRFFEDVSELTRREALHRLRQMGEGLTGVLEWRGEMSQDIRRGYVLVQNSLFENAEAYVKFRNLPRHAEWAEFIGRYSDRWIGDYDE